MAQAPAPTPRGVRKMPTAQEKSAAMQQESSLIERLGGLAGADVTMEAVKLLLARQMQADADKRAGQRFDNIEAKVAWEGSRITLPADPVKMTFVEAQKWLKQLEAADQETIAINEVVEAFPFDGAIALMKALKQTYGWATPQPPRSFFERPPTMMSVDVSPTERVQIIWGRFAIPGIEGELATGVSMKGGRPVFCIQGSIKKKHTQAIAEIAELTRQLVATESIYRGKAVKLDVDEDGDLNLNEAPTFVDVSQVDRRELIFAESLTEQITTNLFTPIERSEECRANKIPLKRGILMVGEFGTGKTLCAYATAQIAQENGWTFVTVDRVSALKAALLFGVMYQPCVIFAEDIDRETTGERTAELDDILNTIDGIASKGKEIMTVLTSNNATAINRAMMRPGRLDAVLHFTPPDAGAAEKLMRLYGRDLIAADETLTAAATELAGQIPAVIREVVERAKLYAISRIEPGEQITLRDHDLMHAAQGMKLHLELLNGPRDESLSDEHKLGAALARLLQASIGQENGKLIFDLVDNTNDKVEAIAKQVL